MSLPIARLALAHVVPPEIKGPNLAAAPTRQSVACSGAVSLGAGQFVRIMCPVFNAATFRTFLGRLLRQQHPDAE